MNAIASNSSLTDEYGLASHTATNILGINVEYEAIVLFLDTHCDSEGVPPYNYLIGTYVLFLALCMEDALHGDGDGDEADNSCSPGGRVHA